MKHVEKVTTKYKGSKLPENFLDSVKNADEEDLRVLLAAILIEEKQGGGDVQSAEICAGLDISEEEFSASLKFWRGAGLLAGARKSSRSTPSVSKAEVNEAQKMAEKTGDKLESAHRDGKLERGDSPSYTTAELTALMEKRNITADFIGEAERVYGKIFNQHEVGIVVSMIDYVGFDAECVLMLLSYYAKEKKTLRYIEKAALAFYDMGISDAQSLEIKLRAMEQRGEIEGQIRAMFGMTGRALTAKEKKFITSWVEEWGFGIEMIRLAYDKTVDGCGSPSAAYANSILDSWHSKGIDSPEKVADEDAKRTGAKLGEVKRSFDSDDFFEAALKRIYED